MSCDTTRTDRENGSRFSGVTSSKHPLRILYISEPWTHGAQVRYTNVLLALQQIGTVEVAMLGDGPRDTDCELTAGVETKIAYSFQTRSRANTGLISKLKFTFDPRADYPYAWAIVGEGRERLNRCLKDFDLIWFFKQRAADLFPNAVWPRSVVDIDDVQSTYERAALRVGGPLDRLQALRGMFIWRRRERLLADRFSVLTVCSEEDKDYLRRMGVRGPVHVIPNGFERVTAEPVRCPVTPGRIGFIGGFDHLPNRDGMTWFVRRCWPKVKRVAPETRLRVIGRGTDNYGELGGPDLDQLGWLPDPSDEIKTWSAMVVPIRLGAGTRVKIAQGFSQKCPIISTSFGAIGYGAVDGREMYLADSPDAFSRACIKAIREPEEAAQMAERAWIRFLDNWTWDAIRPRVWAAAEECLRLNAHPVTV